MNDDKNDDDDDDDGGSGGGGEDKRLDAVADIHTQDTSIESKSKSNDIYFSLVARFYSPPLHSPATRICINLFLFSVLRGEECHFRWCSRFDRSLARSSFLCVNERVSDVSTCPRVGSQQIDVNLFVNFSFANRAFHLDCVESRWEFKAD